jgi:hypothetical protein
MKTYLVEWYGTTAEGFYFKVADGVRVNRDSDLAGTIINVRDDGRGVPIYTLRLHDKSATTDGLYFARACELEHL